MTAPRAWLDGWKQKARLLKRETYALYLACRDPRVPWYAKLLAGAVVAYVFSPIDPIPDFIPVIGFLDELIVVPLGIGLVVKLIPPQVMAECRARAAEEHAKPVNWPAAILIVLVWLLLAGLGIAFAARVFQLGA